MPEITIQTLIPESDNKLALDYISEFGIIFGSCIRTAFNIRNRMGRVTSSTKKLKTDIAKELEIRYGVSNTEARAACTLAIANYDSQAALTDIYIDEKYEAIKGIERSIKKLEKLVKKASNYDNPESLKNLKHQINLKRNKIKHLEVVIEKLKLDRSTGKFHVCFGTKKLFSAQFKINSKYSDHSEWLKDWRNARSHLLYYEGAAVFQTGNQLVRYNIDSKILTITVSPCLQEKYGKTVTLNNIKFHRGFDWLELAILPVNKSVTRKDKNGNVKLSSRTGSAQPVTYRFVIKDGKYYLNATIDVSSKPIDALDLGALGVDFNPSSIDWTVIDRHGNLKKHGSIKINVQSKRSNQTKDIIGKACAYVVRIASNYKVPIVIEDLDFPKKKASMKERGSKYARMLSNMCYAQFNEILTSRCNRFSVSLIKVSAAYTSVIGITKYMAIYGLNSGCAAALVIARRGQGRTESLPKSHASFFKKPEDFSKPGAWGQVAKKINICGGINRHKWYQFGQKQVKANSMIARQATANKPH